MGKLTINIYKWSFSIAMLNYQRVYITTILVEFRKLGRVEITLIFWTKKWVCLMLRG
jgi:hypothetical protein